VALGGWVSTPVAYCRVTSPFTDVNAIFFFFFFFFKTGLPAVKTDRERHGASETRPTINHPTTDKEEEERNGPMNTTRNKKGRQQQQTKT
jgi:hypothetical protein